MKVFSEQKNLFERFAFSFNVFLSWLCLTLTGIDLDFNSIDQDESEIPNYEEEIKPFLNPPRDASWLRRLFWDPDVEYDRYLDSLDDIDDELEEGIIDFETYKNNKVIKRMNKDSFKETI